MSRRVVITGIGAITPAGIDNDKIFNSIINGQSWANNELFKLPNGLEFPVCNINPTEEEKEIFSKFLSPREAKRMDPFSYYGTIASMMAFEDSKLNEYLLDKNTERFGVFVSSGIGGIQTMESGMISAIQNNYSKISPFFLLSILINTLPGSIAIKCNLKGPNMSHVTACATSTHAIGEAYNMIKNNIIDGALCGGSEFAISNIGIASFHSIGALSTNKNPKTASCPMSKSRDGFVMGNGSVVFTIEELEHAVKRGSKIYAEIIGYGASCDAHHITSPNPNGLGGLQAMNLAIKGAGISHKNINYINMHATSTPVGDNIELNAVLQFLSQDNGDIKKCYIGSTKSITGHLLGAAGSLEAMIAVQSIVNNIVPPTINLDQPEDLCSNFNIPIVKTSDNIDIALSNSFGFGGTNGSLIFSKFKS